MTSLQWIDYSIMVVYLVFVLGIGFAAEAVHEDQHRLLPLRPVDSGVDHAAWPSSRPTSAPRR